MENQENTIPKGYGNNEILLLTAIIVPTVLIIIAKFLETYSEIPVIYYISAGMMLGCAVLGLIFAAGDSGNTKLWKIYTPFAAAAAVSVLEDAWFLHPLFEDSEKFDFYIFILDSISSVVIYITPLLMMLAITKTPVFKPKKNGKGKRFSKLFSIITIPLIITVIFDLISGLFAYSSFINADYRDLKSGYFKEFQFLILPFTVITFLFPIVWSFVCVIIARLGYLQVFNKKRATFYTLILTVNGNFFLSSITMPVGWAVFKIVNFFWGADLTDIFLNLEYLYTCLFLLVAFVNEMRRTKVALQNTIELEQQARHAAEEKEKQKLEAERANKEKSSFLANMSHEIRTPINGILGLAQIELDKNTNDEMRRTFEMIYSSGKSLLDIINDILDFSKIESGKVEIINVPYDFASMINDTMVLNVTRIGSKPIEFLPEIDPNIPAELIGDPLHTKQILNNLLSNAFKYTTEGYVKFSVKLFGDSLVFTISDTGQGLSPESVKKLGEAYARFNENANVSIEGTGLGMNITRTLLDKMGGTLEVASQLGSGSTFTAVIPQRRTENTDVIGEEAARKLGSFNYLSTRHSADDLKITPIPNGKVLVVDDNATNLYVAEGFLEVYGLNITAASSGFEAIEIINGGAAFDIIFMDHMMPQMDGVETVKRLRESGYTKPIVALTANALIGADKMFLSNGFDGYISKPIDKKALNDVLIKFINTKYRIPNTDNVGGDVHIAPPPKKLTELFILDAQNAFKVLPDSALNDIKLFEITAHAMKSALANMGNFTLSERAKELEFAAKAEETETIHKKLPAFLDDLKVYVTEISPQTSKTAITDFPAVNPEYAEKLISACENYDEKTANDIIAEIKAQNPAAETLSVLSEISLKIMISEFEEAAEAAKSLS
ncbi:MAG: response regulator [Ruminococcus sp.]|jgi:signal transduction histidine kinase/CheY-like chemotaxis protein|nr:response regulator [Ruminococcus sp.]